MIFQFLRLVSILFINLTASLAFSRMFLVFSFVKVPQGVIPSNGLPDEDSACILSRKIFLNVQTSKKNTYRYS